MSAACPAIMRALCACLVMCSRLRLATLIALSLMLSGLGVSLASAALFLASCRALLACALPARLLCPLLMRSAVSLAVARSLRRACRAAWRRALRPRPQWLWALRLLWSLASLRSSSTARKPVSWLVLAALSVCRPVPSCVPRRLPPLCPSSRGFARAAWPSHSRSPRPVLLPVFLFVYAHSIHPLYACLCRLRTCAFRRLHDAIIVAAWRRRGGLSVTRSVRAACAAALPFVALCAGREASKSPALPPPCPASPCASVLCLCLRREMQPAVVSISASAAVVVCHPRSLPAPISSSLASLAGIAPFPPFS